MLLSNKTVSYNIPFADAEVKRICVENWGSDGELTFEQAAAVTSIPTGIFSDNTSIVSFDEFRFFTGCHTLGSGSVNTNANVTSTPIYASGAFGGCSNLRSIVLPDSIASIGVAAFANCVSLERIGYANGYPSFVHLDASSLGWGAFYNTPNLRQKVSFDGITSLNVDVWGHIGPFCSSGFKGIALPKITVIPNGQKRNGGYYSGFPFEGCTNLRWLVVPNILSFETNALYGAANLDAILIDRKVKEGDPVVVATCADGAYPYDDYFHYVSVKVPQRTYDDTEYLEAYRNAPGWNSTLRFWITDYYYDYDYFNN